MSTDTSGLPEYEAIEPSTTFERLVLARLEALEAENRELKVIVEAQQEEIDHFREELGRERAFDRQRISKLEARKAPNLGSTGKNQVEEIVHYLKDFPGYVAPFEAVRQHLGVKRGRFGDILATPEAEDFFLIIRNPNDRRKRLLKLKPKI